MGISLQNVVIPSSQFAESVAFYRDGLGLDILNEGPGFCFLKAGSVNIAIHPADTSSEFHPTGHGYYLDFYVTDLASVKERLVRTGYGSSVGREWEDESLQYILVSDPDGNLLEIVESKVTSGLRPH